ncbi:Copia protein, partial [Mucuna pruriens]
MEEELHQFTRNYVLKLVPKPDHNNIIRARWMNKARLITQGYNQHEGINFTKDFAHVARLEVTRILLTSATYKNINSLFGRGERNTKHLDHALYGPKQAPRAWYERLNNFLISYGFSIGKVDKTCFRKEGNKDFIIVQIYVNDIIFGATNEHLCKNFFGLMQSEFEMSMMGELKFFLRLQVKQENKVYKGAFEEVYDQDAKLMSTLMHLSIALLRDEGKPVDQMIYKDPTKSHLKDVKRIFKYLVHTTNLSLIYKKNQDFRLVRCCDVDYARDKIERKSVEDVTLVDHVQYHGQIQIINGLTFAQNLFMRNDLFSL